MVSFELYGLCWGMFKVDVAGTANFKEMLSRSEIMEVSYKAAAKVAAWSKSKQEYAKRIVPVPDPKFAHPFY